MTVQRLSNHVPTAMNAHAAIELLLETGCSYVVCAEMLYSGDEVSRSLSSVWESVKKGLKLMKLKNLHY
jgi:hypothetical protein